MASRLLNTKQRRQVDAAVAHFVENRQRFEALAKSLIINLGEDPRLGSYIHFIKYRTKDPEHLRRKLIQRATDAISKGRKPNITAKNLFSKITDLAGVRILHLHIEQIDAMNRIILQILEEHKYRLLEGPRAICWDVEYAELFKSFGIQAQARNTMYTSVHYVIEANQKTKITAELQVRTLMEEVWGEVSHKVDYPRSSPNRACRDQLKVLARFTSGCTRLVDSIFRSHQER